ncbi:unnamed protein product [Lymnaea stagnalis]|uniref:NADH dehydrogenase [ubiquinone] iron-sulfur protein 5 n=1 Tax=Lymnaea stagnalis TaxID=6523 RepID=A0AAV2HCX5_LYMST
MSLPIIYTPITKLQASIEGPQGGPCGHFHMDFFRCASRVGMARARYDCKKELADFHECFYKDKQLERVRLMDKERKRQGRPHLTPLGKDIPDVGY